MNCNVAAKQIMEKFYFFSGLFFKNKTKKSGLMIDGMVIHATVDRVGKDFSVRYNSSHPYILHCYYTDPKTGFHYKFRSLGYPYDIGKYYKPGDYVTVYVEPGNYYNYYVDIDSKIKKRVVNY